MGPPPGSQVAPLPPNLPFRLISRTIGTGAYAFIRKAVPLTASTPIIAIKFINKDHAFTHGRLRPSMLTQEIALHKHLGSHNHIIRFYSDGESELYKWIAMELASGGDLFDKIEADVGVGQDIAHFYFSQLMSAVGYMHSKGVAHRDLKPENLLVSASGDLKVADFGLAALFKRGGELRLCNTVCGSPPYIAPEVVTGKRTKRQDVLEQGYKPQVADVWSCGIILFTLLVGNTPWDEPTTRSYEFQLFVESGGRSGDELWTQLPSDVMSLLRGMLKLDPEKRFALEEVRTHPWMTRSNPMMDLKGRAKDPITLATQMMETLKVDFTTQVTSSQRNSQRGLAHPQTPRHDPDAMGIDDGQKFAATQPETPIAEIVFDWERPSSQPMRSRAGNQPAMSIMDQLMEDPALSQFTQNPAVPLSLTQVAKRFGDIVPSRPLTEFLSALPPDLLVSTVIEALHKLGVPATPIEGVDQVFIRIKTLDGRSQALIGNVIISQWNSEVFEVKFVKLKGDPLEWRRFFKNMCAHCKDAIIRPDQH